MRSRQNFSGDRSDSRPTPYSRVGTRRITEKGGMAEATTTNVKYLADLVKCAATRTR